MKVRNIAKIPTRDEIEDILRVNKYYKNMESWLEHLVRSIAFTFNTSNPDTVLKKLRLLYDGRQLNFRADGDDQYLSINMTSTHDAYREWVGVQHKKIKRSCVVE